MHGEGERPEQPVSSRCAQTDVERGHRLLGRVMSAQPLGSLVRMTVSVPGWPGARPGQFVMLQAEPSRCFLARPLSVCDEAGETVAFLVAPVGDGTNELCGLGDGGAAVGARPTRQRLRCAGPRDKRQTGRCGGRRSGHRPIPAAFVAPGRRVRQLSPSLPGQPRWARALRPRCSSFSVFATHGRREGAAAVTGVASRLAAEGLSARSRSPSRTVRGVPRSVSRTCCAAACARATRWSPADRGPCAKRRGGSALAGRRGRVVVQPRDQDGLRSRLVPRLRHHARRRLVRSGVPRRARSSPAGGVR